jgi:hypothetical protein
MKLKYAWFAFVTVALFFAAWPNAEQMFLRLYYGRAWIGVPSARLYLQDPGDWRDSVAIYGFPIQENGAIVPYKTRAMLAVMWTSPAWAERDIPFVCIKSEDDRMGWVEVSFPDWIDDWGPQGFEWQAEDEGGMFWQVTCEAEWNATDFDPRGFPPTGYITDIQWERIRYEDGTDTQT